MTKFKHAELLENEYLRTYVNIKKPSHEQSTQSQEFSQKRQAAVGAVVKHISKGNELTTKHVKDHIRQNAVNGKLLSRTHTGAQRRMEALLSEKSAKIGASPITKTMWFRSMIGVLVVANAIQLGVEVDYPEYKDTYFVLDHIFTAIFTVEMIVKFKELHLTYFKDCWNVMDFVLVWLSIVDSWIMPHVTNSGEGPELRIFSMLRILRILRLLRTVRLLSFFNELWKIVKGIMDSLRAVSWTALLLLFLLYICGVFCCVMVGKNKTVGYLRFEDEVGHVDELGRDFDVYQFYGTVPRAMYTLFETCIEPLNIRPVVERQPWMGIFFLAFIFISTFGVLNVIIGVIVQHTMLVSEESKNAEKVRIFQEKMDMLELVRDCCFVDRDEDGNLSVEEIQKAFENPLVLDTLEEVEMPLGLQPEELFDLLDENGNGQVTHDEMLLSLTRATVHNEHQQLLDLKIGLHTTQRQMHNVMATLAELQNQMRYGFGQMLSEEKMQSWPTRSDGTSNLSPRQLPNKAQTDASNADADEVECSGVRESAENNANMKDSADEECVQNVKTQNMASLSSQDPVKMPCIPECALAVSDGHTEKNHFAECPTRDDVGFQPGIQKGGCHSTEENLHRPDESCRTSTSSQELPVQPSAATAAPDLSMRSVTEPPPLLTCSDVEAPPRPPDTEEYVPLKIFGPGLHSPCDDPVEEAEQAKQYESKK